jgi:Zn-dependent metalloprotease
MNIGIRLATVACLSAAFGTSLMAADFRNVGATPEAVQKLQASTEAMVARTADAMGTQAARALDLDANSDLKLKVERALPLNLGRALRFVQTYNGVPIWNAEVIIEEDTAGKVVGLDGSAVYDITQLESTPVQPRLTPQDALDRAKGLTGRSFALETSPKYEQENASLVYYLDNTGALRLSYHTTFFTTVVDEAGGTRPTRPVYILDANTGETLDHYENIQYAEQGTGPGGNQKTGRYAYGTGTLPKFEVVEQGTTCKMDSTNVKTENLNHGTSGSGTPWQYTCYENTVKEINGGYSPLNDAHSFGKVVFDMYKDWYGASPLNNKLHLQPHYGTRHENAYWTGQGMLFGDGYTRFYPLVSLDVVSHEVSHGFTEQNSGLIYRRQSGGMNEAFSDMAGEAAEFYYVSKYGQPFSRPMPDNETGADIFKATGQALRYMCDPTKDGRSRDHIDDYQDTDDVHHSSGIYNKAFCELSKRPGWDTKKAFDVFVVANQSYWVPNETFRDGAAKVLKAAQRLQYPEADVVYAFRQVGIDLAPSGGKDRYLFTTLRVIASGATRGCGYSDWNCMTQLCRGDLQDNSAWRGWAGCYRDGGNFQCYFECGQVRKFF